MKKFKKNLVIFIIAFVSLNILFSLAFKKIILEKSVIYQKDAQFEAFNDTLEYLLLGDSRLQNDIDPRFIDNCFNYSSANENYAQSYYRLKYLIESGVRPSNIVMQIDYGSFSKKHSDRFKYDAYWINYMNYWELAKVKQDWKFIMKYIQGKFFPYLGEYKLINEYFVTKRKGKKSRLYNGFKPRFTDFSQSDSLVMEGEVKAKFYLEDGIYWDEDMVYYFEKIMEMCDQKGIKMILIAMPMTRPFLNGMNKLIPDNDLYERIDLITGKYYCVEGILDYQEYYADRPELFWNPDHMNNRGAREFSKMLKKDFDWLKKK